MISLVTIAICIGVLVTLVTIIAACVCGCKNSNQKSELIGTAGVVKIHYDEDAPSPTPTTPASIKRASTQNSHRSLPEIPHPVGRHDSGDTTSEIYATVNLNQAGAEIPTPSSREHPYEHAYAKLQNDNHVSIDIQAEQRNENDLLIEDGEIPQSSNAEPVPISASVAISGLVPSSQELPYITPPTINEPNVQHFSGDSTDSTKGYTSISVREPLSNILAQSKKAVSQPHYATVSDDSDEMYAAIDEASAGNGSDTYAQIVPHELRDANALDTRRSLDRDTNRNSLGADVNVRRSAPPEMGVVAANAVATHSRQPSSSSASASASALGSPKPEKRQANSPLPPTPSTTIQHKQRINSTGDLHINNDKIRRSINEKHQRNNSCVSSSDFYGCNYPVDKHRFSSSDLSRPLVARELNFDIDSQNGPSTSLNQSTEARNLSDYATDPDTSLTNADSPSRNLDDMYAKVIKKTKETPQKKFRGDDPGYETIDRKRDLHHGYETINKTKKNQDPGYETVKEVKKNSQDSGPNSLLSSDPGYEHIHKMDNSASDSDPNYEVLRTKPPTPPYTNIEPNYTQPTYSTVNKKHKYDWSHDEVPSEPNYESMPHDPLYTTGSESDPNYESVRPKDYESISTQDYESLRLKDPKYESVRSNRSKDGNYESVKYFDVDSKEPPYEKVGNSVNRSDSMAGYESIQIPSRPSVNNGDTVSDYFQV